MANHSLNFNLSQIHGDEVKELQNVVGDVKPGESIVISVGNNDAHQSDRLFDALVLNNFEVTTKTSKYNNKLNIIGVKKKD